MIVAENAVMKVPKDDGESVEVPITILYEPKARSDFIIVKVIFHNNNTEKTPNELTAQEYNYVDGIVLLKRKEEYYPVNKLNNKFIDHSKEPRAMEETQQKREYPPMKLDAKIPFGTDNMKTKGSYVIEQLMVGGKESQNTIEWLQKVRFEKTREQVFEQSVIELSAKYKVVRKDPNFMKHLSEQITKLIEEQYDNMPEEEGTRF